VLAAVSSCHRQAAVGAATRSDASAEPSALPAAPSSTESARCRPKTRLAKIASLSGGFEVGDALPFPGGIAVSLLHDTAEGTVASVALLAPDGSSPRLIDLASPPGDAPPPRLAWRGKDLAVAECVLRRKAPTSELALWNVDPKASAIISDSDAASLGPPSVEPSLYIPQPRDCLGFDMAYGTGGGMVAWDDATADNPPRGVIRVAAVSSDSHVETTRAVSPVESDGEMARVVPNGSGFFVLWVARRPERSGDAAASGPEVTGEARTFAWIEMIAVDSRASARSPVWRLTPTTGHVSAYDVRLLDGTSKPLTTPPSAGVPSALPERGRNDERTSKPLTTPPSADVPSAEPAKPVLLVVARDDGEATDGSGGTLLRVRATDSGPEEASELTTDGLGRGAPILVAGLEASVAPWTVWIGRDERLRLLPLDRAGVPVAASSAEEAFDDSRPLLRLANGEQMLVATLGEERPSAGGDSDSPASDPKNAEPAGLAVFDCRP